MNVWGISFIIIVLLMGTVGLWLYGEYEESCKK